MIKRKGFTLIELMVVILIVAILAAVAIPILRGRIDSAKWSEGRAIMGSVATALRAYAAENDPNDQSLIATYTLSNLGFAGGDCTGTFFGDDDITLIEITEVTPFQFTITCVPGTDGGPAKPPTSPATLDLTQTGFSDGVGG